MKSHKVILTDVDGVLLDFLPTFTCFLNQEKKIRLTLEDWEKGYLLSDLIDIEPEESKKIFIDFCHSDYFKRLEPKACALEAVSKLAEEGWRFIAVTAANQGCDTQDLLKTAENRLFNLQTHFGAIFEDIYLTDITGCKADTLKRFKPSYWVEDSVANAHIGYEAGHHSLIIKGRHYRDGDNILNLPSFDDWHGIVAYIKDYEQQ